MDEAATVNDNKPAPPQITIQQALRACEARLAADRHYQEANIIKAAMQAFDEAEKRIKELEKRNAELEAHNDAKGEANAEAAE